MTVLGAWLKQIILLVLLAVITDMLLPTQTLQKYVRTVLGLAVVAAMLQPVIPFFRGDWMQHLAQAVETEWFGAPPAQVATPALKDYTAGMERQAAATADQYLARTIAEELARRFGVHGAQVSVTGSAEGVRALRVFVNIPRPAPIDAIALRDGVAAWLGVAPAQVVIRTGGG
ncbi:hypothetical protein GCM10010885_02050 [Alicyclobacillus cellulosilyticus]|uniref:Stage III sporulation protein AF n=1 Tax=Alicyclobacillus cellulosilyticus TaxID=1003997 RepID=A0A917NFJ3_9BACL|nr:stage III sporulation protein AF [Alicyclobacillus cellulosilyticus]GGI95967.1 hypothetical protein GCM10010885_02050 [Alicyclobacillus cellulosilyticus]